MKRIVRWWSLLIFVPLFAACAQSSRNIQVETKGIASSSIPADIEERIKDRVLTDGNLYQSSNSPILPLTIEKQVEFKSGDVNPLVYPVSLCLSRKNVLYISDNNGHAVRFREGDSETIGTLPHSSDEHGNVVWPNAIRTWRESLFVSDDEGIKMFGADGSFQRLLRSYYLIKDFTVAQDGTIYINPAFRDTAASNPLVVGLNQHGTKVKQFGERTNNPGFIGLDDEAFLSTSKSYVFVVFKHKPIIAIYRMNGELYRTVNINHPIFSALGSLNTDHSFTHPVPNKFRLPTFVAGVTSIEDHLLVLLHLPVPEILEFDLQGEEIGRYRAEVPHSITDYRGFDGQLVANDYHFWIIERKAQSFVLMNFIGQRNAGVAVSTKRASL